MIITCPQCTTQYQYDEARFGTARTKRLKCPKCTCEFDVANPAEEEADATNIAKHSAGHTIIAPRDPGADTDEIQVSPDSPELPQLAPLRPDMRFSLAVIAGAQAGAVFQITKPRVYLGRGSAMDIQVQDSEVSRRHAMIEIRGDEVSLVDLGATNGCFVEGERITKAGLANQSEFTLGSTTMMLIVTLDRDLAV